MKSIIKTFILSLTVISLSAFILNIAYEASAKEITINKSDVLDYTLIDDKEIEYYYYTKEKSKKEKEIKNTKDSYTIDNGNGTYTTRIFTKDKYYNENDKWYELNIATTTLEEWDDFYGITLSKRFFNLFIKEASAVYYADTVDIRIVNNACGSSWSTCISQSSGTAVSGATAESITSPQGEYSSSSYNIARANLPFDTSDLPDNAVITGANLGLYYHSKLDTETSNPADIAIVNSTVSNPSSITTADYNNFGTTRLASDVDISTLNHSAYTVFSLNSSGLSEINKTGYTQLGVRATNELDQTSAPVARSFAQFYSSYRVGTTQDPYLDITYHYCGDNTVDTGEECDDGNTTSGDGCSSTCQDEEEEEEETSTSTISFDASPDDLDLIDDIGIITGLTFHFETSTSSADWYEKHYFRWIGVYAIFFGTLFLYVGGRVLIELIIRWRK